MSFNNN